MTTIEMGNRRTSPYPGHKEPQSLAQTHEQIHKNEQLR